ncbi:MAG: DUF3592 domain-containing protein [Thiothrix sp.]|uniref:DUF3592 domain-containing protein n=1 Tax=Thiothrix sp. TaxID=1032 RepID=UPI0026396099|nr:DUF3592 domain-containing protein [Thiothrix sp.]MDD5393582.1 DUF3592 domain-containing protein [Thiothrix sp.]
MSVNVIVGLPFVLLGVLFIFLAKRNAKRAEESLTWPSVRGTITSSMLASFDSDDSPTTYQPKVEYEYTVANQPYTGKRIAFGVAGSGNEAAARKVVVQYAIGSAVEVFYNPAKPSDAVLERSAAASNKVFWIMGGVFTVAGLLALVV